MSENKLRNREVIDAELQKTKAELAIAKHRQAKLLNQIKGKTEKERRHRNIVWGSHYYLPKRGGRHYKTLWADKGCSLAFI